LRITPGTKKALHAVLHNFVLGARSFPGNPYDGHTLELCLEQAEILSGTRAKEAFVGLGYRGVEVPGVTIYKA
jgi:IS5 family transposase